MSEHSTTVPRFVPMRAGLRVGRAPGVSGVVLTPPGADDLASGDDYFYAFGTFEEARA